MAATGSSLFASAGVNGFGFKSNKDYTDRGQASSYATASYGAGRFGGQTQQGSFQVFQIRGTATPTFALAYEDWTDRDFNDMVVTVTAVPEPSTYALMLAGLAVTGWAARRRRLQNSLSCPERPEHEGARTIFALRERGQGTLQSNCGGLRTGRAPNRTAAPARPRRPAGQQGAYLDTAAMKSMHCATDPFSRPPCS